MDLSKAEVIDYHPFTINHKSPGELPHSAHHGHTEPREGNIAYSVHRTVRLIVMQQTYNVLTNIMQSVITTNIIYSPYNIIILTLFILYVIYCQVAEP